MAASDDFGLDDDDTEFLAAATQLETAKIGHFQASTRPTKRRRLDSPRQGHESLGDLEWDVSEDNFEALLDPQVLSENQGSEQQSRTDDEIPSDYYFPGELGPQDEQSKRHSKYKIHQPRNGGQFKDQIFTQTQTGLDLSPSHFRGAIWKRPQPPAPPAFGQAASKRGVGGGAPHEAVMSKTGPRQTTLNGFTASSHRNNYQTDAELAARLQVEKNSRGYHQNEILPKQTAAANRNTDIPDEFADLPSDAFASSDVEGTPKRTIVNISSGPAASQGRFNSLRGPQQGLKQMTIFGQPLTQDLTASQAVTKKHAWPLKSRDEPPSHHKLDDKAMETWVYPTNLGTIRDYQYNIVSRSLFHNTLVALPTGLGKTFIAATVMLNYYRWTKDAHIVFMAPTKPLIAQQAEACYGIVGIPRRDTVLMTGETAPAIRAEEWLARRVFFMTPQTVINDLKTGICDPKKTVLVVVDEAHKATGGYAYTEVIKFYRRFNASFRVLALTATPGSTVEAVQSLIDALGIARVELRTEQSLDIRQYTHEKHTETELFGFSEEQDLVMNHFSKALGPVLEKLCTQNAYWSRDPMQLTAYGLTQARGKWMSSDAGRKSTMPIKGMVNSIFTVLSSLAHSIGLLKFHGIGPFYSGVRDFEKNIESGQTKGKYATQIAQSDDFVKMMRTIRGWTNNPEFIGHPKLEYLREVVLNHFLDAGEGNQGSDVPPSATRVMVFASYRDSTEEICRVLKRNEPMIRPHVFVGQAASKGSEGMDQKRQNAVIQDFKSGKYNTLVATSIGEEGLDIGTVDLIVCYDASASPIRMLQRIGRTGRKRLGKVVLLLMKGKEENDYAKAQDSYVFIQKSIADASKYDYRDDQSPRILPKGVQPIVDKRVIDIPIENSQPLDLNEKARRAKGKGKLKRPPKKFHMPDGVRTGFVKASKLDSDDEDESDTDRLPKSKSTTKKKEAAAKKPSAIAKIVPDVVHTPSLGDVLLDSEQERDLEKRYAHTSYDDADLVIHPPDPLKFPEALKEPGPTRYLAHGRASISVARTLRAFSEITEERVERLKDIADMNDLNNAGVAGFRLVSPELVPPEAVQLDSDAELPENPLPASRARTSSKARSKNKESIQQTASIRSAATTEGDASETAPVAKKPRGRPKKSLQRSASIRSAATIETVDSIPTAATKKPRGRPKKARKIQRTTSYGSAAAEGAESSPEPTPANMRLGTQGIDLGSRDTSGEEEDEELDSELAEFVVRSDQPIEMASSSQQLPDDTQPSRPAKKPQRKLMKGTARTPRKGRVLSDSGGESDESDASIDALGGDDDASSVVEELPAPTVIAKGRKKRVIEEDSDE